jgi:formate dehydrogenase major subunit
MGALPDRLPGFQHVTDDARRQHLEQLWGTRIPARPGKHQTAMMHAMEYGELRGMYVIGENPVQSDADAVVSRDSLKVSTFSSCRTSR